MKQRARYLGEDAFKGGRYCGRLRHVVDWNGSVMCRFALFDRTNLLSMGIWVVGTALTKSGIELPSAEAEVMLVLAGVLTFLGVFFLNQCFTRWSEQWVLTCIGGGQVMTAASLLRGYVPQGNQQANQIVRYMNAAHALAYVGLPQGKEYTYGWFLAIVDEFNLLDKHDIELVASMQAEQGPAASFELSRWCLAVANQLRLQGLLTDHQSDSVAGAIVKQRESLAALHYYDSLPIPFAYYNIVTWTLLMFRPSSSYYFSVEYANEWYFSWAAVLFVNLVLVGVITLAEQLATPYGIDDVDISVSSFVIKSCKGSIRLAASEMEFSTYCSSANESSSKLEARPFQTADANPLCNQMPVLEESIY